MPENIGQLTNQWLLDKAPQTADREAWLLIQGFPATGFARILDGRLELRLSPSGESPESIDWRRYFDVRMFGPKGEWHLWLGPKRAWRGRFRSKNDWPREQRIHRYFALWGTTAGREGDWYHCTETRGAEVWVPAFAARDPVPGQPWRPARLRIRQQVACDETGIAFVRDAMILGFEHADGGTKGEDDE